MNPLLEQFLQEARENLKFIEQNIESLGEADDELINSIFRAAHTLKGGSGICGFEGIKRITHKAEDLLDMLRAKKIEFREEMIEALFDAFDEVLNLVEAAEQNGDVVEADQEIEERVIGRLQQMLGEDPNAVEEFSLPFALLDQPGLIVNADMGNLRSAPFKLPFKAGEINAENLEDPRLYGIFFDVTEDCMVFGNDPVYVLSLLKENLISIQFCLSGESIKDVLSGFEDEDGLKLHAQLSAVVYGTYSEIEEALYNFIDDILVLPLDISTLLGIDKGESQAVDFIGDFVQSAKETVVSGKLDDLASLCEKSLDLMNKDSKEANMVSRLLEVSGVMESSDSSKLLAFLEALSKGEAYVYVEGEVETAPTAAQETPQEDVADAPVVAEPAKDVDPKVLEVAKSILEQQFLQLQQLQSEDIVERVHVITQKCAKSLGMEFEVAKSHTALSKWLGGYLGKEASEDAAAQQESTPAAQSTATSSKSATSGTPAKKAESAPKEAKAEPKKDVIGKVVKVEQESIDHLMSVVGELLVAKNSLPYLAESVVDMDSESTKRAVMEKYSFINRLTNQLQDLIMSMRMLPISYVFDRYPKLVREISKNLNKKVKLTQEGGETKLDKNMIEVLADPLIHIVRNSLDHGIETPEVRREKGKQEIGELVMKAYPQSDKVVIQIDDDGAGIDTNRIVRKVLEKELLHVDKIEAMSDQEKLELIMMPGFSTAESISEYSGRGVGMDVVKRSVEGFGGSIELKSVLGRGTSIKLSIPVSLAVTTLLHISMKENHYGFPMENVSETVKIEKEEITYLNNEPFIYLREHVIPLLFINSMLDHQRLNDGPLSIVVLNIKGNLLAVVVNELLGQLDVVQKPLDGILAAHPLISGTALLGNGQIIMILDPIGLLGLSDTLKNSSEAESAKAPAIPEAAEA